jgi:hypothetical protein
MAQDYAPIDAELADGRLWRARELLAGRVAASDFDPELFRRYAAVLQAMGDQDEAGRFYMLAGERSGTEGLVANQFLRRRALPLPELWSAMPDAARRISPDTETKPLTALLLEAGYDGTAVAALLSGLVTQHAERETHGWTLSVPHSLSSETAGVVLSIAAAAIFLLGLLKLMQIFASLLGYY